MGFREEVAQADTGAGNMVSERPLGEGRIFTFDTELRYVARGEGPLCFDTTEDIRSRETFVAISRLQTCKYCNARLRREGKSHWIRNAVYHRRVKYCRNCGWWTGQDEYKAVAGYATSDEGEWGTSLVEGILRYFDVDSLEIPLEVLRSHIRKKPEILYKIHPRKLEELVGSIFSDFFDCEVKLTAQTVDRGIDLLAIRGDANYLVQVKRRSKPSATERVEVIRELAGVLLISGEAKGIVVSTAKKFSKQAVSEANSPHLFARGYRIELITYSDLLRILNVVVDRSDYKPPWISYLDSELLLL